MSQDFKGKVYAIVRRIPRGSVLSYQEVAMQAGRPGAARAVGSLMRQNHDPAIPCHRVIKADGTLGGYNGGVKKKRALLKAEGVIVD